MVVAAPATMEEGRILLVGNESDILHSAFTFPINQGGKRYPSADHYAHAQILTQLGLDEVHILELLATSSVNVSRKARELLVENMPPGHDMNSLSQYLTVSRQSYTMMGLRLRAEQDKRFRQTLMETGDALLIVCDRRDTELGIGMDDETFVAFARRRHANAERISGWMHDERQRPKELGQNQLGFFLMWLRYELREKEKAKWLSTVEIKAAGLSSRDEEEDKPALHISISDFVLALQGPFQPLSNYYALTFELKGCTYRSVEHYAYQRLFEALHLSEEEIMKIRTTVKPVDVAKFAKRLFARLQVDPTEVEHKSSRLDRWRQSAMKYKITKSDYLQKLLLSTGHALLLETTVEADPQWSCGTDEFEFQHLLTKRYISAQQLVNWQCGRAKLPPALAHLGGNKTGLLLMELRAKMAGASTHRMPLIAPLTSSVLRSSVSNHMICFSPESVLHPFYPADIRLNDGTTLPSAAHLAAQMAIRFLNVNPADADWIMEPPEGPECWERLHTVICHQMQLPLEKIQQWYMEERQLALKEAMKLQFDQNPALLRVLLDTQDALLVSCARFSSVEAELNIGVRERDLRLWLSQVQQDSKQLMDLCLRPMAFRPPYFGGNRLGILLMELRREFILAGVFPHQLPELAQPVDALLGSESPMENYAVTAPFDVLDEANFAALWANPYLLMLKQQLEAREGCADTVGEQWEQAAMSRKLMPLLISRDEPQIASVFERLFLQNRPPIDNGANGGSLENGDQQHTNGGAAGFAPSDPTVLDELSPEMLRSVYIKMASQFRHKLGEMDELHKQIGIRSRDSGRLQDMRRMLERNREHLKQQQQNAAENPAAVAQLQQQLQQQAGAGGIAPPPPLPQLQQQQQQQSAPDSTATEQQMQSSAQWTQAAAMSAGGAVRRHSPPTADQQQQPFIIGSRAEMTGNGGGGGQAAASTISAAPTQQPPPKIPSLLPELFASPQQHQMQQQQQQPLPTPLSAQYHHHPPPHHHNQMAHGGSGGGGGRMPLPPQLSTTQQTYGSGGRRGDAVAPPPAYGDRRPARWERPISSRRGSGRRGGGGGGYFGGGDHHHSSGGGGGSRRSQSPTSYGGGSGRRRASRSPPPPRHHRAPAPYHKGASSSAGHRAETSRERDSSSRRGSAADATSTSGGGQQQPQPTAAVEAAPPAVKKPKRVVDQSELSEGEILSDEDE